MFENMKERPPVIEHENGTFHKADVAKVAKGAGISLMGSMLGRGLLVITNILIARFFGPAAFGYYILGITVLRISKTMSSFGLSNGAMKFVSMHHGKNTGRVKGIFIAALSVSFAGSVILASIVYLSASFTAETIFHMTPLADILRAIAFCIPFAVLAMVLQNASRGFHTAKYIVLTRQLIQPSVHLFLVIVFCLSGLGLIYIVQAFLISQLLALLGGMILIFRSFPALTDPVVKPVYDTKNLMTYSLPLLFNGLLALFLDWTDTFMLGIMRDAGDVGIYRAAAQVPLLLSMILTSCDSVYAPTVSSLFYEDEKERMEKIFKTTTRWIIMMALPASLILFSSAEEIMSLFGGQFAQGGDRVIIILTIGQFVNCITGGVGMTLVMTGRQKIELANSLALLTLNIALNLLLIPAYGIIGAAVGSAISIIIINTLRLFEVYHIYKMHPYAMNHLKPVLPALISILFIEGLSWSGIVFPSLLLFSIKAAVILSIFLAFFKFMGLNGEERYLLDMGRQKYFSLFNGKKSNLASII